MPLKTTFIANQQNIHSGSGFLFINALRPLYGMQPILDGNNPPSLEDPPTPSNWAATTAYALGTMVLDSNNNVEIVTTVAGTGTSGSTAPTWPTTVGGTVLDGTSPNQITWTMAGPSWVWAASKATTLDQQIRDSNNNVQQCVLAGTSASSAPTWSTIYGGITVDGTAQWQCYGPTLASGASDGTMDFQAQAKLMAVDADQFTAPIGQRLVGEEAKLSATLRELQMTTMSRSLPNAVYTSGSNPNFASGTTSYEELSFGGLVMIPLPCLVLASPRPNYANPYKYVVGTLYKAAAGSNGQLPFSLKKITDYKADWTGNAITWRPAGDQLGQIYRQL
jgi:hypothetical protein